MFTLNNRVAVITGASSGLGVQFARALSDHGADIVLLARRAHRLEDLAAEIRSKGRQALPLPCDVADSSQVRNCAETTVKHLGKADILVNCAGIVIPGPALDMSDDMFMKVVQVNLAGVFYCCREFAKFMIPAGYGRIINIASVAGLIGASNPSLTGASYHASKGGVVNLTRTLAAEWGKYGVTVNCLCPGWFESEMTEGYFNDQFRAAMATRPIPRTGRSGELSPALLALAADEASYTTGSIVVVDGGNSAV